jgi:hypothetical protein
MEPVLYDCPVTGRKCQTLLEAEEDSANSFVFVALECAACRRIHFVNPSTGQVMGRKP